MPGMRPNRPIPFKPKHKTVVFVVDGESEFWYIQMLKKNERWIKADLHPLIPQKKKLADQYKKAIELANDYDKVFWIVDFDVINKETLQTAKGKKTALQEFKEYDEDIRKNHPDIITIIINNPCFEYWLLLHFVATSRYYDSCDKVIRQLKKHLPDYEKTERYYKRQNKDIYLQLKPYLGNAIANAKNLGTFDFNHPHTGMTQMQLFLETLDSSMTK
jgi:hypothetical protein